MSWTATVGGKVLLRESKVEVGRFHQVTFAAIDSPAATPTLGDDLREHLPGTQGHFQVDGDVPSQLRDPFNSGKGLLLRFDTRGATVEVGVEREGDPTAILLHETGIMGTQFPFTVTGPIDVRAS